MIDFIFAVWGIAILLTLFGFVPYGIWMIYTAIKKRWKRLGLQIGISTVTFLLLMGITAIVNSFDFDQYLTELFDTKVQLGDPIFQYDSDRAFNGDGYSLYVYQLPSSIRTRFEAADEMLLAQFPKRSSVRNHWSVERWKQSPFDNQFKDHLDFALTSYDVEGGPELTEYFEAIRTALKRKGTYYAFLYYSPTDSVGNVDLFIVDLNEGLLYMINHNT